MCHPDTGRNSSRERLRETANRPQAPHTPPIPRSSRSGQENSVRSTCLASVPRIPADRRTGINRWTLRHHQRTSAPFAPNGRVRALVVGDVLRRLIGRSLAQWYVCDLQTCMPCQFGCNTRAGTEAAVRLLRVERLIMCLAMRCLLASGRYPACSRCCPTYFS